MRRKSIVRTFWLWRLFRGLWRGLVFVVKSVAGVLRHQAGIVHRVLSKPKGRGVVHAPRYESFPVLEVRKGSWDRFESSLAQKSSFIALILGARGSGKSALGMKLLENLVASNKKKCYAMGFDQSELPSWIRSIESVEKIENDAYVLIDEGGILFSSRSSMSSPNKMLSELLMIARHKKLSILFISQNSSNLEINAIRQADMLLLKPFSLLQLDFERKRIKEIYEGALVGFEKYKDEKGIAYIYGNEFVGFVTNPLPSFWSQSLSTSFSQKRPGLK